MYTWFWLVVTSNHLWWMILPGDVGLLVATLMIVSGIITCLIFDSLLPREPPTFIPKRHRQHNGPVITTIFKFINDGITFLTKGINKLKVQRRRRPPGLYTYSFRPRRKKYKARLQASLTGMTTTWAQDNNASPRHVLFRLSGSHARRWRFGVHHE